MKRHLKEQILALRQEGKTLAHIKSTLKCSYSTIAYHLYEKTRKATVNRINPTYKHHYNRSPQGILIQKYLQFFRLGHRYKISDAKTFTIQELKSTLTEPYICYLTGKRLDLSKSDSYSFDHKIPLSRGGQSTLSNLGLCSPIVNRAKSDMTEQEFVELCKQVLIHYGYNIN
jgi:5-methylcytosine-specific restriction endonuclease McrA